MIFTRAGLVTFALWVGAGAAVEWAFGVLAGRSGFAVGGLVGDVSELSVAAEAALGAVVGGLTLGAIGAVQSAVVRRYVAWAWRWAVTQAAAGFIGGGVMLGLYQGFGPGGWSVTLAVGVGLTVLGWVVWFGMRDVVSKPVVVALGAVVGLVLAGPVGAGLIGTGGFGGVYALMTGIVLLPAIMQPAPVTA